MAKPMLPVMAGDDVLFNDILADIVAFETGALDNLYAYSKEIILNALEQLNQNAKNRLMQQEKLME